MGPFRQSGGRKEGLCWRRRGGKSREDSTQKGGAGMGAGNSMLHQDLSPLAVVVVFGGKLQATM